MVMNRNELPGSVVTDEMMAKVKAEAKSDDKGKSARLDRAAKQVAILRGIGYRGAHIGGFGLKFEQIAEIIEKSEEMADSWRDYVKEINFEMPNEWYYYKYDAETGLNTGEWSDGRTKPDFKAPLSYKILRFLHDLMFVEGTIGFKLNKAACLDYLRQMMEIRFFEEKVFELLGKDIIKGASHLYAGQEATAVGAIAAITDDDLITSTHRGHGHCLAMGDKHARNSKAKQKHLDKMMAELCGKSTGYCRGRGGSMHIADVETGNLGATGIVGGLSKTVRATITVAP